MARHRHHAYGRRRDRRRDLTAPRAIGGLILAALLVPGCASALQRADRALERSALEEAQAWIDRAPASLERDLVEVDLALARDNAEAANAALDEALLHASEDDDADAIARREWAIGVATEDPERLWSAWQRSSDAARGTLDAPATLWVEAARSACSAPQLAREPERHALAREIATRAVAETDASGRARLESAVDLALYRSVTRTAPSDQALVVRAWGEVLGDAFVIRKHAAIARLEGHPRASAFATLGSLWSDDDVRFAENTELLDALAFEFAARGAHRTAAIAYDLLAERDPAASERANLEAARLSYVLSNPAAARERLRRAIAASGSALRTAVQAITIADARSDHAFARELADEASASAACDGENSDPLLAVELRIARDEIATLAFAGASMRFRERIQEGCDAAAFAATAADLLADAGATAQALSFYEIALHEPRVDLGTLSEALRVAERDDLDELAASFVDLYVERRPSVSDAELRDTLALLYASSLPSVRAKAHALLERAFASAPSNGYVTRRLAEATSSETERQTIFALHIASAEDPWSARARVAQWRLEGGETSASLVGSLESLATERGAREREAPFVYRGGQTLDEVAWLMLVDVHLERGDPSRALEAARSFVGRRGLQDESAWRVLWQHRPLREALAAEDAEWLYREAYAAGLRAPGLSLAHGVALLDLGALDHATLVLARAVNDDREPLSEVVESLIARGETRHVMGVLDASDPRDHERYLWEARAWLSARDGVQPQRDIRFAIGASAVLPWVADRAGYAARADAALFRALGEGASEEEVRALLPSSVLPRTICALEPLGDALPRVVAIEAHASCHGWDAIASAAAARVARMGTAGAFDELAQLVRDERVPGDLGLWYALALARDDLDPLSRTRLTNALSDDLESGAASVGAALRQRLRAELDAAIERGPRLAIDGVQGGFEPAYCATIDTAVQAGWQAADGPMLYDAASASMANCHGVRALSDRVAGYELANGALPTPSDLDAWVAELGATPEVWGNVASVLTGFAPPSLAAHAAVRAAELLPARPHFATLAVGELLRAGERERAAEWTARALDGARSSRGFDLGTIGALAAAWHQAGDAWRAEEILRSALADDSRAAGLARLDLAALERARAVHDATRVVFEGARAVQPVPLEYAAEYDDSQLLSSAILARAEAEAGRMSPRDAEALVASQLTTLLGRGHVDALVELLERALPHVGDAYVDATRATLSRQRGHTRASALRLERLPAFELDEAGRFELATVYARRGDTVRAEAQLARLDLFDDAETQRALTQWWALFGAPERALAWRSRPRHEGGMLERERAALAAGFESDPTSAMGQIALVRAGRGAEVPPDARPSIALAAGHTLADAAALAAWDDVRALYCAGQPECAPSERDRPARSALGVALLSGGSPPPIGRIADPYEQAAAVALGASPERPDAAMAALMGVHPEELDTLNARRVDAPPRWNPHVDRDLAAADARRLAALAPGVTALRFRAALLSTEPATGGARNEEAARWVADVRCHPAAVADLVAEVAQHNAPEWTLSLLNATERCARVGTPLAIEAAVAAAHVRPSETLAWATLAMERAYDPVAASEVLAERLLPYEAASEAIDAVCTERIAAGDASALHRFYRGVARARQGDVEAAIGDLDAFVAQSAALATALPVAIAALIEAGAEDDARRYAEQLAELRWIYFDGSLASRQTSGLEGALYALREAPEVGLALLEARFPGAIADPVLAEIVSPIATLYEASGEVDVALALYRRAVLDQPGNPTYRNNLAWTLVENGGDLDEAVRHARAAVWLTGARVPAFLDTLAWTHFRRGELDDALAWQLFAARSLGAAARGPSSPDERIYYEHLDAIRDAIQAAAPEPEPERRRRRRARPRNATSQSEAGDAATPQPSRAGATG